MRQYKKPKHKHNPPIIKKPIIAEDVNALEDMQFKWCATTRYVDYDEGEWGWNHVCIKRFFNKLLNFLQHYENKTWAQMKEGQHCHPVSLNDIVPKARRRIIEKFDDMDGLYQVKAQGNCRLFGRKDQQIFYLIWHDEHHTVYPGGE